MSFASNMVAVALKNIRKFGADVTVTRADDSTAAAKGVIDVSSGQRTPPDQVVAGDRRLWMAAADLAFTPEPGADRITVGGSQWELVSMETIYAQGSAVLYDMRLRQ